MRLRHPRRAKVQEDLFRAICQLAHPRAATPALRQRARVDLLVDDEKNAFARVSAGSRVAVVFNGAGESAELHVPLEASGIPNGTLENLPGPHRRWRHAKALWRSSCRPLRRDLSVSGLRSLSLRYHLGGQYHLRDHHFGAAEERYREAHVGDARKGRSVHQLSVAHNVDAAPTGG